jgi:glutaconate CoA-transferase subunit B
MWLDKALIHVGFATAAADLLPKYNPKEFFRPAQVDAIGNFNNIAFGQNYLYPRMRLPGTGGIPDVTTYSNQVYLYVPRHSRMTFVEEVDFASGMGHVPRRLRGCGPNYLVTDLGQFDWGGGRMRLVSYHPGTTIEHVQRKTGFKIEIAPDVHETPVPTEEQVRLLREEIDPLGVRKLELLSGNTRKQLLREILYKEEAL